LPAEAYQLTIYNYREPEAAWRGLNAAISSQLEITIAPFVGRFLDEFLVESLKPFGIDSPHDFLRAAGPEVATVRLDADGESLVLIASIRDRQALQSLVRKRLGAGAKSQRVGDAEMLVGSGAEPGAASFVGDHLIIGDAQEVRRCLSERAASRTLGAAGAFQQAARPTSVGEVSNAVTYTNDYDPARRFVSFIGRQSGARSSVPPNAAALQRSLSALPYASSETRLVEGGFEKTTRSTFGQFGGLVVQLAEDVEADK
jgi:hypothetical protein